MFIGAFFLNTLAVRKGVCIEKANRVNVPLFE
jgi:hypothetical protein